MQDPSSITLTSFLLNSQREAAGATGDFTLLMSAIQLASKATSSAVRKAGILSLHGLAEDETVNVQGESQKKLDILSNDTFVSALKLCTKVKVMVSEENEEPIVLESSSGKYCACFDPLDGSSNIEASISVGTIYGIYKAKEEEKASVKDVLQPGSQLVAAGYCMYGSSTQMVLTFGDGVHIFTLDPSVGEFILTMRDVKIPEKPKTIYSANEGNWRYWPEAVRSFVNRVKHAEKPYSARYVGSMVADVHRTLLYGGIFMYPADSKTKNGKLRLLYEANPMSMIIEQAGGKSVTGNKECMRVLDIVPESIHQRTGIFLGCKRDIDMLLEELNKHGSS